MAEPTTIPVTINTEGIDQVFLAAFMEAKLGQAIAKSVEESLKTHWNREGIINQAVDRCVKDAVSQIASKLIEEYKPQLEAMVRTKFTDEVMQKVVDDGFAKLLRNY